MVCILACRGFTTTRIIESLYLHSMATSTAPNYPTVNIESSPTPATCILVHGTTNSIYNYKENCSKTPTHWPAATGRWSVQAVTAEWGNAWWFDLVWTPSSGNRDTVRCSLPEDASLTGRLEVQRPAPPPTVYKLPNVIYGGLNRDPCLGMNNNWRSSRSDRLILLRVEKNIVRHGHKTSLITYIHYIHLNLWNARFIESRSSYS